MKKGFGRKFWIGAAMLVILLTLLAAGRNLIHALKIRGQIKELEQEKAAIRQKYLDRAKAWLEELKSQEEEKKEQLIAAQKVRLADANAKMERAYTRYGDNWVNTLFHQTVDIQ